MAQVVGAASAAPRPPEVARSDAAYVPDLRSLAVSDAARAQQLVATAVDPMYPYAVVNRSAADAVRLLTAGGRITNVFDVPDDSDARPFGKLPAVAKRDRAGGERILGIHGEGELEAKTVYGSLRLLAAPLGTGVQQAAYGANAYGPVSFVLRQEVLPRAFLLPLDHAWSTAKPGGVQDLREVALERVLHSHGLIETRHGTVNGPHRGAPDELRRRFGELLAAPDDVAAARVREELTAHTAVQPGRPLPGLVYMEADVGAPTLDDVAAIHFEPSRLAPLDPEDERLIRQGAGARGIPILG